MTLPQLVIVALIINQAFTGLAQNAPDLELKLLHVIFRHGEKIPQKPLQSYPNDPHLNYSYHPIDNGDLTNAGKLRMYEIGKRLRSVYGSFFGDYYLPSEIYTRSTDLPRTEMSLQLVLAGLFPPVREQIWSSSLQWQPITFDTVPSLHDPLFFPSKCSLNSVATKNAAKTDAVAKIVDMYKEDMEYIANHSGKSINSLLDVIMLHNLLDEETAHNLTLPNWTKKVYPELMKEISIKYLNSRSCTKDLRRYNGGFLLHEFTQQMRKYIEGTIEPSNRKAFIYSGHEFNIIAIARTLGFIHPVFPNYGSTFIIETLRDKNNRYYIKILLWTGKDDEVIVQSIPECSDPCPLDEFLRKYNDVIPTIEEVAMCQKEAGTSTLPIL